MDYELHLNVIMESLWKQAVILGVSTIVFYLREHAGLTALESSLVFGEYPR